MTLLHFFLFVLFLATLASAASAAVPACSGKDLIARLRSEAPEKSAEFDAAAQATLNGEGIFWKISRHGLAPSWLFGTMHTPDPRIARLDDEVAAAFGQSTTVVVENTEAFDRQAMLTAMAKLRRLTLLADGTTLDTLVGAEALPALRAAAESHGIAWPVARLLQPWLVAAAIAIAPCDSEAKADGAPVLDQLIVEKAAADGKQLVGLETIEEQFSAIAGLPQEFHLNAIRDLLALGAIGDDLMETTKQLYLAGNTGMMLPLARAFSPRAYAGPGADEFTERLVADRNRHMASRALPYLAKGGVFMAIGALHLPGSDGVVELLRRAGFSVERAAPSPQSL